MNNQIEKTDTPTEPILVDEKELQRLGFGKRSWFQYKRWAGGGPPYMKVGGRCLYDKNEVITWFRAQTRSSTSAKNA